MRQDSVSQAHFARAPAPGIARSKFDRSCGYKTTFNAGPLIPFFVDEALPGDTFNLKASIFARLNTPIVPILDNMHFETFFFEVPYRQVWDNWAKFNGEQDKPGDSTDFLIPQITSPVGGYTPEDIYDYLGLPTAVAGISHSALPLRAINHIYNTWFRDQNLQESLVVPKGDGPDDPTTYKLFNRGKRHDYFTSALPWPQKSDSGSVPIPLGTSAPIITVPGQNKATKLRATTDDSLILGNNWGSPATDAASGGARFATAGPGYFDPDGTLIADLTNATAATINVLRQSIAVQRLFERDARGGTRLIEVVYNHFKVKSPDLRLQRPGYLGGGKSMVNITPVAQTTQDIDGQGANTPQGNLAGFGTVTATNHGFNKSFTEHTIIVGFCAIRADLTYQRGLNRMWSRRTRFDHFWPELSTIGEQELLTKEIWAAGTPDDETVWGYQERFAEYRYKPSLITGKMRSNAADSLDVWHLSQDFQTKPLLNTEFITENPPVERAVAVKNQPHFKLDAYFQLNCVRPMPMFGIPGLDKL